MAEVVPIGKRWSREEKNRDRELTQLKYCNSPTPSDFIDEISHALNFENYLTRPEFEQCMKELSDRFIFISEENERLKKKVSYLDTIVMKHFINNIIKASHENNISLRQTLELPSLTEKADKNIILELGGILEDIGGKDCSSVDILKHIRGE